MTILQPVILCGGSGTRLWPLSTSNVPKQLIPVSNKTFLERTIERVLLINEKCKYVYTVQDPILVINKKQKLPENLNKYPVILEDYANDTGVAVAKAVLFIRQLYAEDVIMLCLPADHYIFNINAFTQDLLNGVKKVDTFNIVLFGIQPSYPETGYGYIIPHEDGISFKEKPDVNTALNLIQKNALWNSGIFAANIDLLLDKFKTTEIMDWIDNPREGKAPSFDVCVLQQHGYLTSCFCSNWGWSDVGTWNSFLKIPEITVETQNISGNVTILNRANKNIVTLGCRDLIIVTHEDNILIMDKNGDYNSDLKKIAQ